MAGRPRTISDAQRRAIVKDAEATIGTPDGSVRRIAARHGVSESTVRRIVANDSEIRQFGSAETRARMKNAIAATVQSNEQKRARLAELLLDEALRSAEDMRSQRWQIYNFGGKDNTFEMREIPFVPAKDRQILATTAAICADKHKMLDQYDSDAARGNAVDAWLAHMMGGDK